MADQDASGKAASTRAEAFERWWKLSTRHVALPEHHQSLAREAYYAAWGGSALPPLRAREEIARIMWEHDHPGGDWNAAHRSELCSSAPYYSRADAILSRTAGQEWQDISRAPLNQYIWIGNEHEVYVGFIPSEEDSIFACRGLVWCQMHKPAPPVAGSKADAS